MFFIQIVFKNGFRKNLSARFAEHLMIKNSKNFVILIQMLKYIMETDVEILYYHPIKM